MRRPTRPAGSALVIVLALGLLVGIQIYIVMVYTSGSFRHTEKVTAHVRAIFVGESAFAQILARLRSGRWEDRWFKGGPALESDRPLAGGTYSSYVNTATTSPEKQVDVWLESHYEGSTSQMYYRVLCVDDGLDFTAQMYPRFFTFLQDSDPTPLNAALPLSVSLIQSEIIKQQNNLAQAVATIESAKGDNSLAALGDKLGIPFSSAPLDTSQPIDPTPPVAQANYLGDIIAAAGVFPPPPPPAATPAPAQPQAPQPPENLPQVMVSLFQAQGLDLKPGPLQNLQPYFGNYGQANEHWDKLSHLHYERGFSHWTRYHVPIFFDSLASKYESLPVADPIRVQIKGILDSTFAWFRTHTMARIAQGGVGPISMSRITLPPVPTRTQYNTALQTYMEWWKIVLGP
jgi:hypothetical protein